EGRGGGGRGDPRALRLRGRPVGGGGHLRLVRRAGGAARVPRAGAAPGPGRAGGAGGGGSPAPPRTVRPAGPRLVEREPLGSGGRRPERPTGRGDPRQPGP